jgi:restriction endonuclease S subunit
MLLVADEHVATNEFIWGLLNSYGMQRQLVATTAGAAAPRINIKDLKALNTISPPIELQRAFSAFVRTARSLHTLMKLFEAEAASLAKSLSTFVLRET